MTLYTPDKEVKTADKGTQMDSGEAPDLSMKHVSMKHVIAGTLGVL